MRPADDTIFALSSGAGVAAVAVIRLSGPRAGDALQALTCGADLPEPRRLVLRRLREPESGELIDEALVAWLPGPGTFTGEDMVELHCHGSLAVIEALLAALAGLEGLRAAERGEFTRRALLAGRMDLLQVEGLADLLAAETAMQRRLALQALGGAAGTAVRRWRQQLVELLALAEAAIDFIDEEDVADAALAQLPERVAALRAQLTAAVDASRPAERLRAGVRVVIAGPPNVGKSSLLNWLAGRDIAIVSATPGTTRDVLEARLDIDGVPVIVSDTAGLRAETADEIERIGMARALERLREADVIIRMGARDVAGRAELPADCTAEVIEVMNKADLGESIPSRNDDVLHVSVHVETGLDSLVERLRAAVAARFGRAESALFARARQRQALQRAVAALEAVEEQLRTRAPVELPAEHLRQAARALDELTGHVDVEEVLGHIFNTFCIGK